jgi:hypothetical protein
MGRTALTHLEFRSILPSGCTLFTAFGNASNIDSLLVSRAPNTAECQLFVTLYIGAQFLHYAHSLRKL